MQNRETTVNTNKEVENGSMNYGMKKSILYLHYLTSKKSFAIVTIFQITKYFPYHMGERYHRGNAKMIQSKVEIYSLRLTITNTRNNIDTNIVYISHQYFYQ